MCFLKEIIKELPGGHLIRCFQPDIWSIFSTGHGKSCCGKALEDRLCITHVISDLLLQLCFSLRRVNSLACSLYNVRSTIKLGSVASCPETVKLYAITHQFLRNNSKSKTNACKASIFGKASKLDGTGSRTLALINAVRDILLGNICLICCIIDDHAAVFVGVVDPLLKSCLCDSTAGRIVREAEIDQIRYFICRYLRKETILLFAGHVDHTVKVLTLFVIKTSTSGHNVGIYIYRINWVANCNLVIQSEDLLDVSGITFCSIGNKDLVCADVAASGLIIIFCNGTS